MRKTVTLTTCACGCGDAFPLYDSRGRPRSFLHGHNSKLHPPKGSRFAFSPSELEVIETMYPSSPREEIKKRLPGRFWSAIGSKAWKMGLRRFLINSGNRPRKYPVILRADAPLAYLAGFFDGEGSVQIVKRIARRRHSPHYSLVISCSNAHPKVVEMFRSAFGGSVISSKRNDNSHISYMWRVYGQGAASVLESLQPYLVVKAQRVKLAVDFQGRFVNCQPRMRGVSYSEEIVSARERCWEEMRALNEEFNFRGRKAKKRW